METVRLSYYGINNKDRNNTALIFTSVIYIYQQLHRCALYSFTIVNLHYNCIAYCRHRIYTLRLYVTHARVTEHVLYNNDILKATTRAFRDGPPRRGLIVLLFFYDNDIIKYIPQSPRRLRTLRWPDNISNSRDSIRTY